VRKQQGLALYYLLTPQTVSNCLRLRSKKPEDRLPTEEITAKVNKYKALKQLAKLRFERTLYDAKAIKVNVRAFFGGKLHT